MQSFTTPHNLDGQRFDKACVELSGLSRKKIRGLIDSGQAFLNGKRIWLAKYQVKEGDVIELRVEGSGSSSSPLNFDLQSEAILLENEDFLVLDKPAGISVDSVDNNILAYLKRLNLRFTSLDLKLAHRLDKDTSGLLIITKNETVRAEFGKLFAERKIKKTYRVLCFDTPPKDSGTIDFSIVQHPKGKNVYFAVKDEGRRVRGELGANLVSPVSKKIQSIKDPSAAPQDDDSSQFPLTRGLGGKRGGGVPRPARTDYKLLESLAGKSISYLECCPHTGRPHQIRVHLKAIGNPVLGDKIYAEHLAGRHPHYQLAPRQMLHAYKLEFEFRGQHFEVISELPEDFKKILEQAES